MKKELKQSYRGFEIEWFDNGSNTKGWIADLGSDEVFCDTLEEMMKAIDEYLDWCDDEAIKAKYEANC